MTADTEWVLSYSGTTLTMGKSTSDCFFLSPPVIGSAELRTEDGPTPRGDGDHFGQDYVGGRTLTFELGMGLNRDEAQGLTHADEVAKAWRADAIRKTPGSVASLAINTPSRHRVVYGRPRRYAPGNAFQTQGFNTALADFKTRDDIFYDGDEQIDTIVGSGSVIVGGDVTAWPIYTITFPAHPVIDLGAYTIDIDITGGSSIVIDTRPWVMSVKQGSVSRAGKLSLPLRNAGLDPGSRLISVSGAASVQVKWRDSYTYL